MDDQFENQVIDRLARIETTLQAVCKELEELKGKSVTRREYNFLRNGFIGTFVVLATAVFDYFFSFIPHP
jgi:hypothetical protein